MEFTTDVARRDFLKVIGAGGLTLGAGSILTACQQTAGTTTGSSNPPVNTNDEYVYLSIVTQVPFWVDHKAALNDFGKATGVKTSFVGPPDFNVQGQATQLDQIVSRKPAGIVIFIGDADAMTPGINRAVDAGIPVILVISDAPKSKRTAYIGIDGYLAGRSGAARLAEAIGGRGKVAVGSFPSPNVLDRARGYKDYFTEHGVQVVAEVNDEADPSKAPSKYAAAIAAHPDLVAIAGCDGDSGLGAARAVIEAGKKGQIKIMAMDRNDDMLAKVEDGTILGSVVQKSYDEMWLACWMLYWLNHNVLKPVPDWRAAGINPLPEQIITGVWPLTKQNVAQFKHKSA